MRTTDRRYGLHRAVSSVKTFYLVDTNILFNCLAAYVLRIQLENRHFQIATARRIQAVMERTDEGVIHVPDLVWAEFVGVVLQKNMDVSVDLDQLRLWFRQREGYIQQMQRMVLRRHRFWQWSGPDSPYVVAQRFTCDVDLIDQATFSWMAKLSRGRGSEKLLDGMDAVILAYLNAIAQSKPESRVVLYTTDRRLALILPRVRDRHEDWFAQNTDAEYAPFVRRRVSQ